MKKTKYKFLKLTNHIKVCFSFQHFNFPNEMNFSFFKARMNTQLKIQNVNCQEKRFLEAQSHNLPLSVENLHDFFSLFATRSQ